jgi:hypothetical protein
MRESQTRAARSERAAHLLERKIAQAILVIEDQPGDYYRRACRQCGAAVRGYVLPGGSEVIRCANGHTLTAKQCRVVEN